MNDFEFENITYTIGGLAEVESTADEIKNEPMVHSASPEYAYANGGPITKQVIDILNNCMVFSSCPKGLFPVIDTRVHMLMRNMYPAIPGWHADGCPRGSDGQPDVDKWHSGADHYLCVIDASDFPTESLTRVLMENTILDISPYREGNLWASIHDQVELLLKNGFIHEKNLEPGYVHFMKHSTLHRAVPAVTNGWRYFFRMSFYHSAPKNEIRRQTQVYQVQEKLGW